MQTCFDRKANKKPSGRNWLGSSLFTCMFLLDIYERHSGFFASCRQIIAKESSGFPRQRGLGTPTAKFSLHFFQTTFPLTQLVLEVQRWFETSEFASRSPLFDVAFFEGLAWQKKKSETCLLPLQQIPWVHGKSFVGTSASLIALWFISWSIGPRLGIWLFIRLPRWLCWKMLPIFCTLRDA